MSRGAFRRLIVGTAIVVAAGVTVPEVAVAAPPQAASAAAEVPSTMAQRGEAAALVDVTPDDTWLAQSERGFVSKIYYRADELDKNRPLEPLHQKLREAAIAALAADGEDESSRFIKTKIFAADTEDKRIIGERIERRREENTVKSTALGLVELPVSETILAKSVYEFIVYIDLNANAHNNIAVLAAARAALQGNTEAQWAFLRTGIHEEHKKDVARLIQERTDKTEAEKEQLRKEAARLFVAQFAIDVTPAEEVRMSTMADLNFVIKVWEHSPDKQSQVAIAAEAAFTSGDAAKYAAFIDTGASAARIRDIDNLRRKQDEERTRQIFELRTRAANSLMYLELVKAADAALAGTPDDRREFLATGQHQHRTQSLRIDAYNGLDSYVADHNGSLVIVPWRKDITPDQLKQQQWKIEPGLSNPECFSFQSVSRPLNYLRRGASPSPSAQNQARIPVKYSVSGHVAPTDGTDEFKADATWCVRGNAEAQIVRPVRDMSRYLTVNGAINDGWADVPARWHAEPPTPVMPIDRRYNAEKNLRDSLGKPTGDAVLDTNYLGYKPYEKGRLYLTSDLVKVDDTDYQRVTVHVVYNGPVLDKLLSMGGPNAIGGEMIDQAPTRDGRGQVLRFARPRAGGQNLYIVWSAATGAHIVFGGIGEAWAASGGEIGPHGYPVTDETQLDSSGNRYSRFTTGTIYYRPNIGIIEIKGTIHAKFAAMGFEATSGYPIESERPFGNENGRRQYFSRASFYITPRNGTVGLAGEWDAKHGESNFEAGPLGYPLSDVQNSVNGGQFVLFSGNNGGIYKHPSIGLRAVYGAIGAKYRSMGAERSFLGYPNTEETALPRGTRSTFQNGRIDTSNDGGTTVAYQVTSVPHRAVQIKGVHSGRCIQTAGLIGGDALKDLAAMELWQCVGGEKQIWDVVSVGNNVYGLKNRHSGKCLDLRAGDLNNGNQIIQYECHLGATQQWEFTTAADGTLALRSVLSGKTVEALNAGDQNATLVTQVADSGQAHQRWTFIPMG
ncbi:RICIN domain-containing protein [Kibdelosporangium philippinense]|uniref:RICIN domain-containing protein n=1 Tax=Kibdelosporangium philippinense TaxID=211113 RepID=A0ABS8Z5Y1_9PSEU|nr:RICIN domain-containing protein [Kibdelosporangium philippinense]MCE7002454.1 RICIN domain-containing protein [Kibdelosporangium philippinense]